MNTVSPSEASTLAFLLVSSIALACIVVAYVVWHVYYRRFGPSYDIECVQSLPQVSDGDFSTALRVRFKRHVPRERRTEEVFAVNARRLGLTHRISVKDSDRIRQRTDLPVGATVFYRLRDRDDEAVCLLAGRNRDYTKAFPNQGSIVFGDSDTVLLVPEDEIQVKGPAKPEAPVRSAMLPT